MCWIWDTFGKFYFIVKVGRETNLLVLFHRVCSVIIRLWKNSLMCLGVFDVLFSMQLELIFHGALYLFVTNVVKEVIVNERSLMFLSYELKIILEGIWIWHDILSFLLWLFHIVWVIRLYGISICSLFSWKGRKGAVFVEEDIKKCELCWISL